MCRLYSLRHSPKQVRAFFHYAEEPEFPPRAYIAPATPIAIIRRQVHNCHFSLAFWGLIPSWVKEVKPDTPLVNARSETVLDKPSFRHAMKRRRCLIPADGFYTRQSGTGKSRQALRIHKVDNGLFAFAGLWEDWQGADGSELETAAIITTSSNQSLAEFGDRMPAIIMETDHRNWLDVDGVSEEDAASLLRPAPDDFLVVEPASIEPRT